MEEEEEEGRNGKRADGDVKTSSPSEKTAGQGRSGTTNHDETSEGVERVGVREVKGEWVEGERGR